MISKLNNVLLGLFALILVIGIVVIVKGADNMSVPLRAFVLGVLVMVFLSFIVVAWLVSYATKRRKGKK
jgi:hypothetical protein